MVEVDVNLNSGVDGEVYLRYLDPDNWYRVLLHDTGRGFLEKSLHGSISRVATFAYTTGTWRSVKIKASGSALTVWVDSGSGYLSSKNVT